MPSTIDQDTFVFCLNPPPGYRAECAPARFLYCSENPSDARCANVGSFYNYKLNEPAYAVFLALFALSGLAYLATAIATRRTVAFCVALILGIICEILGYAGRIWSATNQWIENPFLIQICTLTIGPAFMAASLYLCLRRIVAGFGEENSRIRPEYYTRIFIPCDVISLVLQATGGGMASVASHNEKSTEAGDNVMIAGLAFQSLTLLVFILVSADFALTARRRYRALGAQALAQNPDLVRMRASALFRGFLAALSLATVLVLWRSVFRVAELSGGWAGPIMYNQSLFIGFEGVLVLVAVISLNVFHPAWCARPLFEAEAGRLNGCCGGRRGENKRGKVSRHDSEMRPGSVTDGSEMKG